MEAGAKDLVSRRERLLRLVDAMHEGELETVETFIEFVHEHGDPVLRAFMNAPENDEPISPEEEEAVREGLEDVAAGRMHTLEEVKKEFGL